MEWLQVLVLAAVQGLTEFLPVSSSAHLVLVPVLTGWPDQGLAFDVAVHVGSLAAVLVYFRGDFAAMLRDGLRGPRDCGGQVRLGWLVVIATVPVGAAGLTVDANLAESLRDPLVIAVATIGFGLALLFAAGAGAKDRGIESIGIRDAIVIGCAQAIALVPGTSRAGITMTAGLARRPHAGRLGPVLLPAVGPGDSDRGGLQDGSARGRRVARGLVRARRGRARRGGLRLCLHPRIPALYRPYRLCAVRCLPAGSRHGAALGLRMTREHFGVGSAPSRSMHGPPGDAGPAGSGA